MRVLRRYRVGVALVVLAVIVRVLGFYRLKDQQARAVQRPRGDTLVGVVAPIRKDLEVRFGTTADILANQPAAIFSKVSGNELRRHGQPLIPAVINGGRTRLRPILMTTLTTLVGLMPMALGIDVGSEANAPLARAVIGGLAVSTVLTLILIPTLYVMVEARFPRRVEDREPALAPQGETA